MEDREPRAQVIGDRDVYNDFSTLVQTEMSVDQRTHVHDHTYIETCTDKRFNVYTLVVVPGSTCVKCACMHVFAHAYTHPHQHASISASLCTDVSSESCFLLISISIAVYIYTHIYTHTCMVRGLWRKRRVGTHMNMPAVVPLPPALFASRPSLFSIIHAPLFIRPSAFSRYHAPFSSRPRCLQ